MSNQEWPTKIGLAIGCSLMGQITLPMRAPCYHQSGTTQLDSLRLADLLAQHGIEPV